MPARGVVSLPAGEILTYEEIEQVVRAFVAVGGRRVRLTGGEPLVRQDITRLVARLTAIEELEDLSLTTNGTLLAPLAKPLAEAGLQRVNVSVDTLQAGKYRQLTRGGDLAAVRRGWEAALHAGLSPVKLNVVAIKGWNEDEIVEFARLTQVAPLHVRFIELMPVGYGRQMWKQGFLPVAAIRKQLESVGELQPVTGLSGAGPAVYYRLPGAMGTIGFIAAESEHFCSSCNRLRLTATGELRGCLFAQRGINLKPILRHSPCFPLRLKEAIRQAIVTKPLSRDHVWQQTDTCMFQIGG